MLSFRLHYVPIAFSLLMLATFVISYSMSAASGVVSVLFPYISDTGTLPPQSCVFGQLLNLSAFLAMLCAYCWYSHEMLRYGSLPALRSPRICARVNLCFGLLSAIGLSVVGNFQETAVLSMHLVGAFMTFGFGTLYLIMACHACRKYLEIPRWLLALRLSLCIISVCSFALMFVFAGMNDPSKRLPPHKWSPNDKGYAFHAMSCFCEWLLATSFLVFFTTMVFELRDYYLDPVKVRYRYANLDGAIEVTV